jgi:hypothetical protein
MLLWEGSCFLQCEGSFPGWWKCKELEAFLYSPQRTLPVAQTVGARLGGFRNRREMSSQFHLEQAEEGIWKRKAMLRSEDHARTLSHKWLETGRGGSLEGVLTQSDQSGKTWLWCHSGLTAPRTWSVLRQLLLGLLLWQPSQPCRKKLKEGAPVLCGKLLSYVWPREMRGRQMRSTWVTSAHQDWGNPFFTASLSFHAPWFGMSTCLCATCVCISLCRTGRHGSHCGTQAAWISWAHPDYLFSECGTSRLAI